MDLASMTLEGKRARMTVVDTETGATLLDTDTFIYATTEPHPVLGQMVQAGLQPGTAHELQAMVRGLAVAIRNLGEVLLRDRPDLLNRLVFAVGVEFLAGLVPEELLPEFHEQLARTLERERRKGGRRRARRVL